MPLCYNSFQIIKEEWHPNNLLETNNEFHVQNYCQKDQEELFECEKDQEVEENPQDPTENTSIHSPFLLGEAQEDIQPQDHSSQEKKDCYTSAQDQIKIPPLLTEEEIDQILNKQLALKTSFEQNTSTYLPTEPYCLEPKNKILDQLKEKQTDNPICLIGEIVYTNDFPIFDQSGL